MTSEIRDHRMNTSKSQAHVKTYNDFLRKHPTNSEKVRIGIKGIKRKITSLVLAVPK